MNELVAAQREHPVKTGQSEEHLEDRIIGDPHLAFPLVEEIAEDGTIEGDAEIGDLVGPEIGRTFVGSLVVEAVGDAPVDLPGEFLHQLSELVEDRVRTGFEKTSRAIQHGARDLR